MKDSLRFKDTFEDTVRHSLLSAVEHCLYECPVVHSQCTEIPLLSKIDVVLLQNFFVSFHLNGFIIDDDTVEVEEYGLDHLLCALCFVLCALFWVLCSGCFVLCSWCFVL